MSVRVGFNRDRACFFLFLFPRSFRVFLHLVPGGNKYFMIHYEKIISFC